MIHPESNQLFIGPYAISDRRAVRTISYEHMPGRPTANARHLTEPARTIYYFTMEEGLYAVDVESLEVQTLHADQNVTPGGLGGERLPGYHGKGAYTAQGRTVYANNGRAGTGGVEGVVDFRLPSGCLASWDGDGDWQVVAANQHTEVTGPGGIQGNRSADAPLWSIGWDHRSLILKVLDDGQWSTFRLPKADYSYEGLHGWHTEWPRIRQVGPDGQYLMNHHGMWFDFPGDFSIERHRAPRPIASHLKITGDVARWQDRLVFGCDDAALSRFGARESLVGRSQSNLWFARWDDLYRNGRPYGWGGPWVHDTVDAEAPSDPYAFAGFERRQLHLSHENDYSIAFRVEADPAGQGAWEQVARIEVPAFGSVHHPFPDTMEAEWIRLIPDRGGQFVTAYFHYGTGGGAATEAQPFQALAPADPSHPRSVGVVYPRGNDAGTLQFAAWSVDGNGHATEAGYYEIGADMTLKRVDDPPAHQELKENARIGVPEFEVDDASVILEDHWGNRYRLPKGHPSFDRATGFGWPRDRREVVTERDLFNAHGIMYCLPRANSGGVAHIKPIATHNRRITDFCSWRGLLVLAGCSRGVPDDEHFIQSEDGEVGLWFGDVDDLWKLGRPTGVGGPWKESPVEPGAASDPYLMTGFDEKTLSLSHDAVRPVTFTIEVNVVMNFSPVSDQYGIWQHYTDLEVCPGKTREYAFPDGFSAHWVRLKADRACRASAIFNYA
jgi:hypothetical protein